ncbi:tRNA uridine-5-carboxymethylaminomethyl(34) synthesis GTPase MnmE [Qingshengfaniella alkalisoli]|uniref:tRNA modification GTPase MnmE n=1 Tax=Qingshengfaniella alkalisoli TaxID=2599296 RepID=A0A5B8IZF0_9RHOB|nr:tRNA uridine-5-carboxymethylaminomethyl(34) synthesis GTPase MnmE [Qingshengfaniella alkalisoli]QDY69988.1 tRNA uridine-5-carboxymethylaminomethyl(34) synthesis GTPase MnmE [Qingshengfaniella alkalisoli]
MDTIYALASGQGKAGVAVVRLSGPHAHRAVADLAGRVPEPRRAALMRLSDAEGVHLDHALVLTFAKGASFTGEEVAELHLHGSRATVAAVLNSLSKIKCLRLAEAGEFTRRALENGQLDLTEVEALADLIDAETEAQRRQALRIFSGALGKKTEQWRSRLIRSMALIEATIDFADEEVPEDVTPEVSELLSSVRQEIEAELDGYEAAERIRDGFEVAILGRPNIGKSTLLNSLAGREAAITSDIAGTTRDVIEVRMDIRGLPVTFLDTAGLRETTDEIEAKGVDLALRRARNADLRVVLTDGALPDGIELLADDLVLRAKSDLQPTDEPAVSGKTGHGVSELLTNIGEILTARSAGAGTAVRERHRIAMLSAREILDMAQMELALGSERAELAAEQLRRCVRTLDALVGRVDTEQVLDEIFSSFCLGK